MRFEITLDCREFRIAGCILCGAPVHHQAARIIAWTDDWQPIDLCPDCLRRSFSDRRRALLAIAKRMKQQASLLHELAQQRATYDGQIMPTFDEWQAAEEAARHHTRKRGLRR